MRAWWRETSVERAVTFSTIDSTPPSRKIGAKTFFLRLAQNYDKFSWGIKPFFGCVGVM